MIFFRKPVPTFRDHAPRCGPDKQKPRRAGGGAGGLARLLMRLAHAQCSRPRGAAAADTRWNHGAYRKHGAQIIRRAADVKNFRVGWVDARESGRKPIT